MAAADHLRVPRRHGLFLHHGIDLGDGTVAHYLEGREILRSSLEEFSCREKVTVIMHPNSSSRRQTLSRAISRLGEQNYNLLFNNCEHFACWCKTGLHRSPQMEDFLHQGSLGALALGQVIPAAVLSGLRLLLQKGLVDDSSRDRALQGLKQLKQIRINLLAKLESTLEQINTWLENNPDANEKAAYPSKSRNLLLTGQTIADELTAIEDLEVTITALLDKAFDKA